jgi:tRNA/rRNA methyltransferase
MIETAAPCVVLVRPQMGENIGAAARAMLNFGLTRMRLVAPRDGWPNPAAVAMASGAGQVLDMASVHDDTAGAVADLTWIAATTARPRELVKPVLTPREAAAEAAARIAAGERVGFLFGPERAGLENDDIARANAIVTVPVNPEFPSLNLAQCVLLLGHEWRLMVDAAPRTLPLPEGARPATLDEVERFHDALVERLAARGFFFPEERRAAMVETMRSLWGRMPLTDADIRILYGVMRSLNRETPRSRQAD